MQFNFGVYSVAAQCIVQCVAFVELHWIGQWWVVVNCLSLNCTGQWSAAAAAAVDVKAGVTRGWHQFPTVHTAMHNRYCVQNTYLEAGMDVLLHEMAWNVFFLLYIVVSVQFMTSEMCAQLSTFSETDSGMQQNTNGLELGHIWPGVASQCRAVKLWRLERVLYAITYSPPAFHAVYTGRGWSICIFGAQGSHNDNSIYYPYGIPHP